MKIEDKKAWLDEHGDIDLDAEYEGGVCTVTFYPSYYKYSVVPFASKCVGLPYDDTVEELYNSAKEKLFEICK